MKQTLQLIMCLLLGLSLTLPAFAEKWNDDSDPDGQGTGRRVTGSQWPLPTQPGLVWTSTINLTAEQCDGDTDASADNFTRLQKVSDLTTFFTDDGGSFVNDTTDANDAGTDDVNPWPATPAVNDAIYIGSSEKFNFVQVIISTTGSTVMTVTWEYWDSGEWTTLTFNRQEAVDFDEANGTYYNDFNPPAAWDTTTVNSVSGYWVRARVSAFTSHTTDALLTSVRVGLLSTNPGHQVILRHEDAETEDLWIRPCADALANEGPDVDEGLQQEPTDRHVFEVMANPREICVCAEGGTTKIQAAVYNDGQVP